MNRLLPRTSTLLPWLMAAAAALPAGPGVAQEAPAGVAWGWQAEVYFAINQAVLQPQDKASLDRIGDTLNRHPEVSVLLTGRTDNTGDLGYNQALSNRRAAAVADYLMGRGVDRDRIFRRAVGEQRPVASNLCDQDRRRNRRVDLAFFPTGAQPPSPPELSAPDTQPERTARDRKCQ